MIAVIKKYIPASWRIQLKLWQRNRWWRQQGWHKRLAGPTPDGPAQVVLTEIQRLPGSETAAPKLHNLALAMQKIQPVVIHPWQVFSFWHIVGNPSAANGYIKSRSIVQGRLQAATGGGLCQLSGLIYYMAIQAGLSIEERHAHSLDIYTEAERYTPLGSDATVAYGYKDLCFVNNTAHPLAFRFTITDDFVTGQLLMDAPLSKQAIRFERQPVPGGESVTTFANDVVINQHTYSRYTA